MSSTGVAGPNDGTIIATKAKRYDTVVLREPVDGFPAGEIGAVVEVYAALSAIPGYEHWN